MKIHFYSPTGGFQGLRPVRAVLDDGMSVPFENIGNDTIRRMEKRGDLTWNKKGEPLLNGVSHLGYNVRFGCPVVGIKGLHGTIDLYKYPNGN